MHVFFKNLIFNGNIDIIVYFTLRWMKQNAKREFISRKPTIDSNFDKLLFVQKRPEPSENRLKSNMLDEFWKSIINI